MQTELLVLPQGMQHNLNMLSVPSGNLEKNFNNAFFFDTS